MKNFYNINLRKKVGRGFVFLLTCTALSLGTFGVAAHAEGSREIVLSSINDKTHEYVPDAGRSYIRDDNGESAGVKTNQRVKAFVYSGETVYFGSSVGVDEYTADIIVKAPSGKSTTYDVTSEKGYIDTRKKEVLGPNGVIQTNPTWLTTSMTNTAGISTSLRSYEGTQGTAFARYAQNIAGGNYDISAIAVAETTTGYTPLQFTADQTGIYEFEFKPTTQTVSDPTNDGKVSDDDITARQNKGALAAWDVTVANSKKEVINGRVYVDFLTYQSNPAVWSHYYFVTRDGYIYKFASNGMRPYTYNIFANNRGLISTFSNTSAYHSIKEINNMGYFSNFTKLVDKNGKKDGIFLNGPQNEPTDTDYSYHIFFNYPDADLPENVVAKRKDVGKVDKVEFEGDYHGEDADAINNGNKNLTTYVGTGGYFKVTTTGATSYHVILDMSNMWAKDYEKDNSSSRVDEIKVSSDSNNYNFIYKSGEKWYRVRAAYSTAYNGDHPDGGFSAVTYDEIAGNQIDGKEITDSWLTEQGYKSLGRVMIGNGCSNGDSVENKIYWDGRDQYGRILPPGTYFGNTGRGKVTAAAKAGEIHFPIADAETMQNGLGIWLENPPENIADSAEERSKLYYNNANETLLRQGDLTKLGFTFVNSAAAEKDPKQFRYDGDVATGGAYKNLDYFWHIKQNSGANPLSENKSIDGVPTYTGDVNNPTATFNANKMMASGEFGVDHGLSDTWSYVLGEDKTMDSSILLYENSKEKVITGFVFYDTITTELGTYDKFTNDKELPYADIKAYYGTESTPFYTTVSDSIGNYSISVDVNKYNALEETQKYIRIVISYKEKVTDANGKIVLNESGEPINKEYSSYFCTTTPNKENVGDNTYYISEQQVKLDETGVGGVKEVRAKDVGFTARYTENPVLIKKIWTPENLVSDNIKASFDIIGKGADGEEYYRLSGVSVEAILGNQAEFTNLPLYVYNKSGEEVNLTYDVEEELGEGFTLQEKESSSETNGEGKTVNVFTFTNEIQQGKLTETVWADKNGNGVLDDGDTPLEGAKIYVYQYYPSLGYQPVKDVTGTDTGAFVTNSEGRNEELEKLSIKPETRYKIVVEPPESGYIRCKWATDPNAKYTLRESSTETKINGNDTDNTKAGVDESNGNAVHYINEIPMGADIENSVGFAEPLSIQGRLFYDTNFNGVIDEGEGRFVASKVEITAKLAGESEDKALKATIGDTGIYTISGLKAGKYTITALNPGEHNLDVPVTSDKNYYRFSLGPNDDAVTKNNFFTNLSSDNKSVSATLAVTEKAANTDEFFKDGAYHDLGIQEPLTVTFNSGAHAKMSDDIKDDPYIIKAWYKDNITGKLPADAVPLTDVDSARSGVFLGWCRYNSEPGIISDWARDREVDIYTKYGVDTSGEDKTNPFESVKADMIFYAAIAKDEAGDTTAGYDGVPDYKQVIYMPNKPEGVDDEVQHLPASSGGYNKKPDKEIDLKWGDSSGTVSLEGYRFMGWSEDAASAEAKYKYSDGANQTAVFPDSGLVLYAVWSKEYSVRYDKNIDAVTGEPPVDTKKYIYGENIDPPTENKLELDDAVFVGWSLNKLPRLTNEKNNEAIVSANKVNLTGEELGTEPRFTMPNNDVVLYAIWADDLNGTGKPDYSEDELKFTLTFDYNGAMDHSQALPVPVASVVHENYVAGREIILPDPKIFYYPSRNESGKYKRGEHEIFVGWSETYRSEALTASEEDQEWANKNVKAEGKLEMPEKDYTLYAIWALDENDNGYPDYTGFANHVSYNINGGLRTGDNGGLSSSNFKEPIGEDGIFYTCNHYHVAGTEATLVNTDTANEIIYRDRAVFIGWSTKNLGDPLTAAPEEGKIVESITIESHDPDSADPNVVYAVWAADENGNGIADYDETHYNIVYDLNGGSGTESDVNNKLEGDIITLPADSYTKTDAVFAGWSLTKHNDITSDPVLFEGKEALLGETYIVNAEDAEGEASPKTITIYAVWAQDKYGALEQKEVTDEDGSGSTPYYQTHTSDGVEDYKQVIYDINLPDTESNFYGDLPCYSADGAAYEGKKTFEKEDTVDILPDNIRLPGYKFEGWRLGSKSAAEGSTDNMYAAGDSVPGLSSSFAKTDKLDILYAIWRKEALSSIEIRAWDDLDLDGSYNEVNETLIASVYDEFNVKVTKLIKQKDGSYKESAVIKDVNYTSNGTTLDGVKVLTDLTPDRYRVVYTLTDVEPEKDDIYNVYKPYEDSYVNINGIKMDDSSYTNTVSRDDLAKTVTVTFEFDLGAGETASVNAQYARKRTLHYDLNGGELIEGTILPEDKDVFPKENVTLQYFGKDQIKRDGATLLGWSFTQRSLIENEHDTDFSLYYDEVKDMTVPTYSENPDDPWVYYAVWAVDINNNGTPDYNEEEKFKLVYDLNTPDEGYTPVGDAPVDNNEYIAGVSVPLADTSSIYRTRTDDGVKELLVGWSESKDHPRAYKKTEGAEANAAMAPDPYTIVKPEEGDTITLYGLWAEDVNNNDVPDYAEDKYSVRYDGGAYGSREITGDIPVDPNEYVYGEKVNQLDGSTLTVNEVVFVGWSSVNMPAAVSRTATDATVNALLETNPFTMPAEDKTLYAVWAEDKNNNKVPDYRELYTICYDANGGVGIDGGEPLLPNEINNIIPSETVNIATVPFVGIKYPDTDGKHYVQVGWSRNTAVNGKVYSGEPAEEGEKILLYSSMEPYTLVAEDDTNNDKKLTFYAVWAYDGNGNDIADYLEDSYTVRYDMNGSSDAAPLDSNKYLVNTQVELHTYADDAKPAKTKEVFMGWSLTQSDVITSAEQESIIISDNKYTVNAADAAENVITVYAVWAVDVNGNGTPDYNEDKYTLLFSYNNALVKETDTLAVDYRSEGHVKNELVNAYNIISTETFNERYYRKPARESAGVKAEVMVGWSKELHEAALTADESELANKLISSDENNCNSIIMPGENLTVYAVWAEVSGSDGKPDYNKDTYHVRYYLNGGKPGTNADGYPLDSQFKDDAELGDRYYEGHNALGAGAECTLLTKEEYRDVLFRRDKAVLLGWSSEKHELFTEAPEDGVLIDKWTIVASDKQNRVYAAWAEDENANGIPDYEETPHSVIYDGNDCDNAEDVPKDDNTYLPGTKVDLKDKGGMSRAGAVFDGWSLEKTDKLFDETTDYERDIVPRCVESPMTMPGEDVTLYAIWSEDVNGNGTADYREVYTLRYEPNNYENTVSPVMGTPPEDRKWCVDGTEVTLISPASSGLSKQKAVQVGWSIKQYKKQIAKDDMPPDDILTETDGTVKYIVDASHANDDNIIYMYAVWADDANLNGTADYKEPKYTVAYDGNGNEGGAVPTDEGRYIEGDSVNVQNPEPVLTRTGAVFAGWSLTDNDAALTEKPDYNYLLEDTYHVYSGNAAEDGKITFHAVWACDRNGNGTADYDETAYTVTYDANDKAMDVLPETKSYFKGETVTVEDYTGNVPTGLVFEGWSRTPQLTFDKEANPGRIDENRAESFEMPNENVTLYAMWADDTKGDGHMSDDIADCRQKHTFVHDPNGGKYNGDLRLPEEREIWPGDEITFIHSPSDAIYMDDCIQIGWSFNEAVKGKVFAEAPDEGIKLYGSAEQYSVLKDDSDNIVIYAVWAEDKNHNNIPDYADENYTVTYDMNGHGDSIVDTETYMENEHVVICPEAREPKAEGVYFLGWSLSGGVADFNKTALQSRIDDIGFVDKSGFTMGSSNVTLYAVWAKDENIDLTPDDGITDIGNGYPDYKETYTVVYDTNGGEGNSPVGYEYLIPHDSITLREVANSGLSRANAVQVGWSLKQYTVEELEDNEPELLGSTYTVPDIKDNKHPENREDRVITIYAVWEKDEKGNNGADGIPDKYQKEIHLDIVNGSWDGSGNTDTLTRYVVLTDESGKWSIKGKGLAELPDTFADYRFDLSAPTWREGNKDSYTDKVVDLASEYLDMSSPEDYTCVYEYNGDRSVAYKAYSEGEIIYDTDEFLNNVTKDNVEYGRTILVNPNGGVWKPDADEDGINNLPDMPANGYEDIIPLRVQDDIKLRAPEKREGYIFLGWLRADNPDTPEIDDVYTAQWAPDILGTTDADGADLHMGDGIPDMYQKRIVFKIVKGTWDGISDANRTAYVTLTDVNDKGEEIWSANGKADIKDVVPDMSAAMPDSGYKEETGGWYPELPEDNTLQGTADVSYSYIFLDLTNPNTVYKDRVLNSSMSDLDTDAFEYGDEVIIDPDGGIYTDSEGEEHNESFALAMEEPIFNLSDPVKTGCVFMGWTYTPNSGTSPVGTYKARWADDITGDDGISDGIPDIYQIPVTFDVVNGTWDGETVTEDIDGKQRVTRYAELFDNNGYWMSTGTGSINNIPVPKPDTGFADGSWDKEPVRFVDAGSAESYGYTYTYGAIEPVVTYDVYKEGSLPEHNGSNTYAYGDRIKLVYVDNQTNDIIKELTEDCDIASPAREGYVFMGWQYEKFVGTENTDGIAGTYTAVWLEDITGKTDITGNDLDDGDGIPDIYQKKVVFNIVHGTWTQTGNTASRTVYAELTMDGRWNEYGTGTVEEPGHKPDAGYGKGGWSPELTGSVNGNDPAEYTYTYDYLGNINVDYHMYVQGKPVEPEKTVRDTVAYGKNITVDPNGGIWTNSSFAKDGSREPVSIALEEDLRLVDERIEDGVTVFDMPVRSGHIFLGWVRKPDDISAPDVDDPYDESFAAQYIYTAQWAEDAVGAFDEDGNETGDGIPDMYQKRLEYKVVNGTWNDGSDSAIVEYVELKDSAGLWSTGGTAEVPAYLLEKIAEPKPDANFIGGSWYPEEPTPDVSGNTAAVYSFIFMDETNPNVVYKSDVYSRTLSETSTDNDLAFGDKIIVDTDGGDYPDNTSKLFTITLDEQVSTLRDPVKQGYVFMGWDKSATDADGAVRIYKAKWLEDNMGSVDENGSKQPDGIPDTFQQEVVFTVMHGTWAGEIGRTVVYRYAELTDSSGRWSKTGTGSISGIPVAQPDTGYTNGEGVWIGREPVTGYTGSGGEVGEVPADVNYYYTYDINTYNVTYDGYREGGFPEAAEDKGLKHFDVILIDTADGILDGQTGLTDGNIVIEGNVNLGKPVKDGSVFMGWTSEAYEDAENKNVVRKYTANWMKDTEGPEGPDGIPDEYQTEVKFTVINGYWNDDENLTELIVYAELFDGDGRYTGRAEIKVPEPANRYGFTGGAWDKEPSWTDEQQSMAEITSCGKLEYVYRYTGEADLKVTYSKYNDGGLPDEAEDNVPYGKHIFVNPNGGEWKHGEDDTPTVNTVPIVVEVSETIDDPEPREGYMFLGWFRTPEDDTDSDYTYTAQWLENRTGSDDVPDIYQKRVIFRIVNGTWDADKDNAERVYFVTLTDTGDESGKWSSSGKADISALIPDVSAARGVDGYADGSWYPDEPDTVVNGNGDAVYTYIFIDKTKHNVIYKQKVFNSTLSQTDTEAIPFGVHVKVDPDGGSYNGVTDYDVEEHIDVVRYMADPVKPDSVFMGWRLDVKDNTYTFTAQWLDDKEGAFADDGSKISDGIPDIYQRAVIFDIENGTWYGYDGADSVTAYAELKDLSGYWSENGKGSIDNVPEPVPDTGYTEGEWQPVKPDRAVDTANDPVQPEYTEHNVKVYAHYTYTYTIDKPVVSYDRYAEGSVPEHCEDRYEYGDVVRVEPAGGLLDTEFGKDNTLTLIEDTVLGTPVRDGYVFMGWSRSDADDVKAVYTAQWFKDEIGAFDEDGRRTGDNIPDIYQKEITFRVSGGYWIDETTDDIIRYYELRDANGRWSATGNGGEVIIPKPAKIFGYYGYWDRNKQLPKTAVGNNAEEYTYTFVPYGDDNVEYKSYTEGKLPEDGFDATKSVPYGNNILVEPNGGTWLYNGTLHTDAVLITADESGIISVTAPEARNGSIFMGWSVTQGKAGSGIDYIFTAQWFSDVLGDTDENGSDIGDGIPDIYQKQVTLCIVNGTWSDGDTADKTEYVTLTEDGTPYGKWSTNGIGTVVLPQGMQPDEGYTAESGYWDIENDGTTAVVQGNEPQLIIYSYDKSVYSVKFDPAQQGTKPEDAEYEMNVRHGESVTAPAAPVPDEPYYEFTGWSDGVNVFKPGESITVTEDMTLTAQWQTVTTPVEPSGGAFIVEHYLQQLDGTYVLDKSDMRHGALGTSVSAEPESYDGFKFNTDISVTEGIVFAPVVENGIPTILTLRLYYDMDGYAVEYDLNGGTGGPEDKELEARYPEGSEVTLWRNTIPDSFTKAKAVFIGWSETDIEETVTSQPEDGVITRAVTVPKGGITVHAVWAADENENGIPDYVEFRYKVTYDLNGGTGGPTGDELEKEYFAGEYADLWEGNAERENAVFLGWSRTKFDTPADGDYAVKTVVKRVVMEVNGVTVYAVWAVDINSNGIPDYEEEHYTLTYNGNGNTGGYPPVDSREYVEGQRAPLKSGDTLTHEGSVFAGWSTDKRPEPFTAEQRGEAEDIIISDEAYTMPGHDVTLYAVWAVDENGNGKPDYSDDGYHIVYYANGGYDENGDDIYLVCSHHHPVDTEATLMDIKDAADLTMEGAVLVGWSLGQYGLVYTEDDYNAASCVTSVHIGSGDAAVYAVWAADENLNGIPDFRETRYPVYYDLNGGEGGPDASITDMTYLTGLAAPLYTEGFSVTRENAVFLGWSEARAEALLTSPPEDGVIVTEVIMKDGGVTVYAVWAADTNGNGIPDYEDAKYRLIYDGNGLTQGSLPTDDNSYITGDVVTVQSSIGLKRNSDISIGWSTNRYEAAFGKDRADEAGEAIMKESTVTFADSDITLYVVWATDENGNGIPDYNDRQFTVTYLWANANNIPDGAVLPEQERVLEGTMFVPEALMGIGRYSFMGWFTDQSTKTAYTGGTLTSDITLYGAWRTVASGGGGGGGGGGTSTRTITASAQNGGSITPDGKVTVGIGSSKTFTVTCDEGYTLDYLEVDGEKTDAVLRYTFENITSNHTINAVFKAENKADDNTPDSEQPKEEDDNNNKVSSVEDTGVAQRLITDEHIVYLNGYEDNTFRPDGKITRAEAAQLFYNLLIDKDVDTGVRFSDVPETAWYAKAVNTLASVNAIAGVGNDCFAPDRAITRAEFTAIAMRFARLNTDGVNIFTDVHEDEWFYDTVVGSVKYGWISGYTDGTFRPYNTITRAEAVSAVNRMLARSADRSFVDGNAESVKGYDDLDNAHWAYYDIIEASNAHVYEKDDVNEVWLTLK